MATLLKNLLGNGSKDRELLQEMQATLQEMKQERARHEKLIESSGASADRLETLHEPIEKAGSDLDDVVGRLKELEQRFEALVRLSALYQELDERAQGLEQNRERAESDIAKVLEDSQRVRSSMEDLGQKVDLAVGLKDQLEAFLEVEKPFQLLRGEADAIRSQVSSTSDHVVRLREQHDRLLDAHKLAMSKMEALDRRRDELGRDLQDKERRVAGVEQAVRGMDGVQSTVDEVRREMGSLKALADLVGQKTAALDAQREAVDRALAQAEQLDRAMRLIDAGVRQQQDNEKTLGSLQEQVVALRSLHETVVDRSSEISHLQREIDERTQAARQNMSSMTEETKKTVDRFDFERRGMESVTQRVADLRAAVSDCEGRFRSLNDSSRLVAELLAQTHTLTGQIQGLSAEAAQVDGEMEKLQAIRRDLDQTGQTTREAAAQVSRIEESRPAIEAALRDLEQLGGAHAAVRDGLEQSRLAHAEIARMVQNQAETRTWLLGVERGVNELRNQVGELRAMGPTVDFVQKQTQRVTESMSAIESRREFMEDLQRRIADLEALGAQVDERGRQLQSRMDAAEERFVGLEKQADEAERMTMTVASVSSGLNQAGKEAEEVKKAVAAITERAESVEELSEQTRALRKELELRKQAVAEATKDLERASKLREEAATSAQQLDELAKRLNSALTTADRRVARVDELSSQLEGRATSLESVEERMGQFEERLTKWNLVDQEIDQSLKEIVSRQGTVEALKADLDRMFVMVDQTATNVRTIAAAHDELEESRQLLDEVTGKVQEVRDTASSLDERKRQLTKAEDRLARVEGLLADVRSSLESLQGQKAIVDQAVEKAGSLQFLLKQAETVMEGLREERKTTSLVRSAMAGGRQDDDGDGVEEFARAA